VVDVVAGSRTDQEVHVYTSNRGRILFLVMTNRPDKLDVDLKRAGRLTASRYSSPLTSVTEDWPDQPPRL